jgi:hypothetical protein
MVGLWMKEVVVAYSRRNLFTVGARGSVVVEALCYKPEGRGFQTR